MLSRLLENWPYKVAAVLIAIGLRFYVAAQLNPQKQYTVPIRYSGIPSNLVLSSSRGWVHVDLSGPVTDLAAVRQGDIDAEVDLSSARAGKTPPMPITIDLNHDLPPDIRDDVKMDPPTPASVVVTLEPLITQQRNIHVHFDRSAPVGSMYGAPTLSPTTVAVQAPQDVIDSIAVVTADVVTPDEIPGSAPVSITGDFDVVARGSDGYPLNGVTVSPAQVHVVVPVLKAESTKTVSINAFITGSPMAGGRVTSAMVTPAQVTVSGTPDVLAKFGSVMTRPVDVSGASGTLTRRVELVIPPGLTRLGADQVTVEVTIEPAVAAQPNGAAGVATHSGK